MGKKDNKEAEGPRDLRLQAREIADSLAIAFILAMVIRHYVLEVFKIPTKSMEPTLLGDPWTGDKILVNKFAYDFRDPARWEVAVFKYPVDTSKNYIKRVVGLPGEAVRVRDGDVYINGEIARKPWPVQRALWRRRMHCGEARSWLPDDESAWDLVDGRFVLIRENKVAPEYLNYDREIQAYEQQGSGRSFHPVPAMPTSDIMVEFRLIPLELAGSAHVVLEVRTAGYRHQLVDQWNVAIPLGKGPSRPQVFRSGKLVETGGPCTLRRARPTLVQVCNVDRALIVRVDGRQVACHVYEPSRGVYEWAGFGSQAQVRLGCKAGRVAFRDPGIYVDVHYTDSPDRYGVRVPYQLGPGEYFVLGDNSANSNDSRFWEKVPRSYMVGEAFLVLWPLGRMKAVR